MYSGEDKDFRVMCVVEKTYIAQECILPKRFI